MTLPAKARLSTLSREITALTERLAPVGEAAILRSLDAMQTAGLTMPQGIEPKKILAVYHYALAGVPTSGLSTATQKLIRGDYAANPNVLLGTIPKPPVLSALAKAEALGLRAELARKRETIAALAPRPGQRTAESRRRIRARLEAFRQAHAAAKAAAAGETVAAGGDAAGRAGPMRRAGPDAFAYLQGPADAAAISGEPHAFSMQCEDETVAATVNAAQSEETRHAA